MAIQEKLKKIHNTLMALSIASNAGDKKVYHYWRPRLSAPYLIWAEDGPADYYISDNRHSEISIHGTLDYFTKEEYDPVFDEIEAKLTELFESRWRWLSTQYEDGTGLIHHEWEFNT